MDAKTTQQSSDEEPQEWELECSSRPRKSRRLDRPKYRTTGALNSATAMLDIKRNQAALQTDTDSELSAVDGEARLPGPLVCRSLFPSCSSPTSSSTFQLTTSRKRRRTYISDLLDHMARSDELYFEQWRRDRELNAAMVQNMKEMTGLMKEMVLVVKQIANK